MFIKQLKRTKVNTKYGEKEKWLLTDEKNEMYDSWISVWNSAWKEGDTIDIKPELIQSREYNGKIYKTIGMPSKKVATDNAVMTKLLEIEKKLDEVLSKTVTF